MAKILIVEDDTDLLLLFRQALEEFGGHECITAWRGNEAVDVALREKPDLIIMDLRLPKLSGVGAIRAIRLHDPNVPILAITAYNTVGLRRATMEAGASLYLTKPVDIQMLLAYIQEHLRGEE